MWLAIEEMTFTYKLGTSTPARERGMPELLAGGLVEAVLFL